MKILKSGKSIKVLAEIKKKMKIEPDVCEQVNQSIDSVGSSGLKILDGSFSLVKPIPWNEKSSSAEPSSSKPLRFKPLTVSTPVYEDISDIEETREESDEEYEKLPETDSNVHLETQENISDSSFDYEQYVKNERADCEEYLKEIDIFVSRTQDMVEEKSTKREKLSKKLKKYKKSK